MLDKFGQQLKPGEKVTIHTEVVALCPTEPIINLKVRLLEPRPSSDGRDCPALSYICARLSEPSTWRGMIALVTAPGVALSPDQVDKIVAAGLALGLFGAFTLDRLAPLRCNTLAAVPWAVIHWRASNTLRPLVLGKHTDKLDVFLAIANLLSARRQQALGSICDRHPTPRSCPQSREKFGRLPRRRARDHFDLRRRRL